MDITCLFAAILLWLSNLLKLIYLGKERRKSFNWFEYTTFDPDVIKEDWEFRMDNKAHLIATQVLSMLAWFALSFPMLQLAYALNRQKGPGTSRNVWLHTGMVVLTLGGALTEWIGNFLLLGATLSMELMATSFNLDTWIRGQVNDETGWRTLELVAFTVRGMTTWVDAFEWISLSLLMIFTFAAVKRHRRLDPDVFGAGWNGIGLFLGLMCLLEFVTEVLRSNNWRVFSQLALWYGSMNRLVLLPFWLMVLGMRLPHALARAEAAEDTAAFAEKHDLNLLDEVLQEAQEDLSDVPVAGLTPGERI